MKRVLLIAAGLAVALTLIIGGGLYWLIEDRSNEFFLPSGSMEPTIPVGATADTESVDGDGQVERVPW